MSIPRIRHATVVAERKVSASPARVFRAFTQERGVWDVPKHGWVIAEQRDEPRPDGPQVTRFGPAEDPAFESRGRYLVVVSDRLLIMAGVMHDHGTPQTATLTTIDLQEEGAGTRVVLTDQSAYFGAEDETMRGAGWPVLLERLAAHLAQPQ